MPAEADKLFGRGCVHSRDDGAKPASLPPERVRRVNADVWTALVEQVWTLFDYYVMHFCHPVIPQQLAGAVTIL